MTAAESSRDRSQPTSTPTSATVKPWRAASRNAVVKDEGHTHSGLAAIKAWKTAASAKYSYTSEPFAVERRTADTSSRAGSPVISRGARVDLRYALPPRARKDRVPGNRAMN